MTDPGRPRSAIAVSVGFARLPFAITAWLVLCVYLWRPAVGRWLGR
jgi:hypothetical protein